MSNGGFTYQDLLQVVDLIKTSSRFSEFHVKVGEMELDIRRGGSAPPEPRAPGAAAVEPVRAAEGSAALRSAPPAYPPGAVLVKSPMVGRFYRAPQPGASPFVEVGTAVGPETVIGIVEVMKLMNSIRAAHQGVVTQILVGDGEPVEYDEVLAVIEPGPAA